MALPITYLPYTETGVYYVGQGTWKRGVSRSRQAKPYNLPAAYDVWKHHIPYATTDHPQGYQGIVSVNGTVNWPAMGGVINHWVAPPFGDEQPVTQEAIASARKRFVAKTGEFANAAHALIERKQTMELLSSRMVQLARFALAIKKGRFKDAGRILDPRKQHTEKYPRAASKSLANAWLQWWFGISPLVKDIASAIDLLNSPFGQQHIVVRGSAVKHYFESPNYSDNFHHHSCKLERSMSAKVRLSATVRIDNPNLFLFSRLGFTNPAILAYEIVPFSFVLNWFVNIEEWLGQFSEFHGLTMENPQLTRTLRHNSYYLLQRFCLQNHPEHNSVASQVVIGESKRVWRTLGFPSVDLGFRAPWRLSPTRALTIASLLVQRFVGK